MLTPELVSATELDAWAATIPARATFPRLVRRMLQASGVRVSTRSGDGSQQPGWDGWFEVDTAHPLLPVGMGKLELGTSADVRRKAQADYAKRTAATSAAVRESTTFVFATPRRWPSKGRKDDKAEWIVERREQGEWKAVLALDADDIEALLDVTPGVHVWISEQLGKRPREVATLESWWEGQVGELSMRLPIGFFLGGRANEKDALLGRLAGGEEITSIRADSKQGALMFCAACLLADDGGSSSSVSTPLVVATSDAWDRLVRQVGSLVLIPMFDDPQVGAAVRAGHRVLLPLGKNDRGSGAPIELPKVDKVEARDALVAAGVPLARADALVAEARLNLNSFLRRLAIGPHSKPPWTEGLERAMAGRMTLVGGWELRREGDGEVVSKIADRPYPEVEQWAAHWDSREDSPIRRSGTLWRVTSPSECWALVGTGLTGSDMARWRESTLTVLSEEDPARELPAEDRPLAAVIGIRRKFSDELRQGLAEGLALLGSAGTDVLADGSRASHHANGVVSALLSVANRSQDGRLWQSISDVLPLLAEAAPEQFLEALENVLQEDPEALKAMFTDSTTSLWERSPHTGLLWALETVAWSEDYLARALHCLARLASLDPGGTYSNRPANSLKDILLPWYPGSNASIPKRMAALRGLFLRSSDIAWDLLVSLLPTSHGFATGTHKPKFRDWAAEERTTTVREFFDVTADLFTLALDQVRLDKRRWLALIPRLPDAPQAQLNAALDLLLQSSVRDWEEESAAEVAEALRELVSKHRAYPQAKWALSDKPLARLEEALRSLSPWRRSRTSAFLFDNSLPDLAGVDKLKFEEYQRELTAQRSRVVTSIMDEEGFGGITYLAAKSVAPWFIGVALADAVGDAVKEEMLQALGADDRLRNVASGWVSQMRTASGVAWTQGFIHSIPDQSQSTRVAALMALPSEPTTWDLLDAAGPEVRLKYWSAVAIQWVPPEHVDRFAELSTLNGRPLQAMDVLGMHGLGLPENHQTRANLIVESMRAGASARGGNEPWPPGLSSWDIGRLLDLVEQAKCPTEVQFELELAYNEAVQFDRKPRALHRGMIENPGLFVEAVCAVFYPRQTRDNPDERPPLTSEQQARASVLNSVIRSLRELPGSTADGDLDEGQLRDWVNTARAALAKEDRLDVGDIVIGEMLSCGPIGKDGLWPCEAIRNLIEEVGSKSLESGIETGYRNGRGVTTRGVYDGGEQEEVIAERFAGWAASLDAEWPRTSRTVRVIANSFLYEADRHDADAEERAEA